jgi:hypothetical protein
MLFIYYSFYSYPYLLRNNVVVNGVRVSAVLLDLVEYKLNYCKLLRKATGNDAESIRAFTLLELGGGETSYEHGRVIVELIGIIGEDRFLQSLATINNMEKNKVSSYLRVGLEYGKTELQGKPLKEVFPKIYKFLDCNWCD